MHGEGGVDCSRDWVSTFWFTILFDAASSTADALQANGERCLAAGMADCIAKPVRIEDLECVLRRVLAAPSPAITAEADTPGMHGRDANGPIDRARLARLLPLNRPGRENAVA